MKDKVVKIELTEEAKELRRKYQRERYAKRRLEEQNKQANYWNRKAERLKSQEAGEDQTRAAE